MTAHTMPKDRVDQVSGGVFLIGLALLFLTPVPFFPGILFVIGASSLARGMAEGQEWTSVQGALWLFGLGLLFLVGFNFALLLILIGLSMLFGVVFKPSFMKAGCCDSDIDDISGEKPKRKLKNDEGYEIL